MPLGTIVHRRECVASTNDTARELALAGADHGTAVVAGEQTRGRGTKGRVWHSPPGLGLYASFILRGPAAGPVPFLHLLPLAAGLAASDAVLAAAGAAVRLKWPNDLVHDGKKLGGILSEGVSGGPAGDFAVVGVGIN
ncbi:MAG: biotin--[acetyl-CoA-carboxylase] ligase, partial [Acidobacteria bacterium]|nr:biotin--[acetyl-CoA-carboxylase] ligase [Acidobacteriota bacterium]